jgi:hypothetical protein
MDRIGCLEDRIRPLKFYFEHRVQRREGRIYMFDLVGDVPSSVEERGSFSGIFEIVAADEAGVFGWKRRPICAENVDCRPSLAIRDPCYPIYPRHPYLPKAAKGRGTDAQPSCRSTDGPTAQSERVRHRAGIGPTPRHNAPPLADPSPPWPPDPLSPSPTCPKGEGAGKRCSTNESVS